MKHSTSRRPDSGTITIMAIFLLTTMIGMAGLAVDVGFMYTRSRMMYAVADSAVYVGMKDLVAGNTSSISTDIADLAAKYGGAYAITIPSQTATMVQVQVQATYPLFFGKMLGFPSKQMTILAAGRTNTPPPAILALGSTCGASGGVFITGGGNMTVNGSLESNGSITMFTGPAGPAVIGNVTAGCGPVTLGNGASATGTVGTTAIPFSDPFAPYTPPACTGGTSTTTTLGSLQGLFDTSTVPATFPAGVYCSNSNIQLNDPGNGYTANGVTFVSIGGTVAISANKASTITPNAASPNGIIAYSTANTGTSPGDVELTGPANAAFNIGGSFYAPYGSVNLQMNGNYTMTGSAIGNNVWIGNNNNWSIGTPSASGPNAWQMSQ
jgi:hypothetical protein